MIRAFVPLAVLLIPASVQAADARIAIKTTSGQVQSVLLTAPVCGTDAGGSPLLCGDGGSALMAYKTTGGQYQSVLPVVPVCSVTADGTSGLQFVMSYSASGTGSLSAVSASGALTPVDIYETAAWGTTSFKGFTLDSGTITATPTVVDSTFYLTSNAWGTYHVGVGGHLYIVDIFGSGAGKRTIIAWRKVS